MGRFAQSRGPTRWKTTASFLHSRFLKKDTRSKYPAFLGPNKAGAHSERCRQAIRGAAGRLGVGPIHGVSLVAARFSAVLESDFSPAQIAMTLLPCIPSA